MAPYSSDMLPTCIEYHSTDPYYTYLDWMPLYGSHQSFFTHRQWAKCQRHCWWIRVISAQRWFLLASVLYPIVNQHLSLIAFGYHASHCWLTSPSCWCWFDYPHPSSYSPNAHLPWLLHYWSHHPTLWSPHPSSYFTDGMVIDLTHKSEVIYDLTGM